MTFEANVIDQLKTLVDNASNILILQADNPDGDSLGSALGMEAILRDMGKETYLACAVDIMPHLRYIDGWDRVNKDLPSKFDLSIIVDTSTEKLFDLYRSRSEWHYLKTKPCVVIDHHMSTQDTIPWATLTVNEPSVSTCETIERLAAECGWNIATDTANSLVAGLMSDSLGLSSNGTTHESIRSLANLVEKGASISDLEEKRREVSKKPIPIIAYKGKLLQRIEYHLDNQLAIISIPWDEVQKYSPIYNPSMLVLEEMRLTMGIKLAIAFKIYNGTTPRVTAKLRCTDNNTAIAGKLAEHFGGGGHAYASGFKIDSCADFEKLKMQVISKAKELL
jgi:bifunctional oligoribonuclease and PAP phosphatase NrnA